MKGGEKMVNKSYKFRIYPNKAQEEIINKSIGCCRFVYNNFLDIRIKEYEYYGNSSNYVKDASELKELKMEYSWLKECPSDALQQSLKDLDIAYKNFFKQGNGFPKFKSKHKSRLSYRCVGQNVKVADNRIKLPKLKMVKLKQSFSLPRKIKINNATISKTRSGKYFVSLSCEVEVKAKPKTEKKVGIDLGVKEFATLSDGVVFSNPKYYRKYEDKLAKEQRKFSKMKKGSNNREKQRVKVARIHEKIKNNRLDYIHKITTYLVNNYDTIVIEDLNTSGMLKNHKLAKSISDASFYEFRRQLEYKCAWYGKELVVINRWFPSSKTCSNCGCIKDDLTLSDRIYECEHCGLSIDRDLNASINILTVGTMGLA